MSEPFVGPIPVVSSSSASGIWGVGDVYQYRSKGSWPLYISNSESNPANSPTDLKAAGPPPNGFYWYQSGSMTAAVSLYTDFDLVDSKAWVRVFSSPYNSTATVNEVGKSIPWNGFLIQRNDAGLRGYTYFGSNQLFNTRSSTDTSTGGNRSGMRVFIGAAGGHGIYSTAQNPCNWPDGVNAIGAGWNGSTCGSFPDGLLWGTGQSGNPVYLNASGTWETWITW
jgi:hypothetical protein